MLDFTMMEDAQLIEYARYSPDAFGILYRRYLTPIYRYLYHKLGNSNDAEDLTAQVFTEALEGLVRNRYRDDGCFIAWLFTIARRRTVDFYRQRVVDPLGESFSTDPGFLATIEKNEDSERLAHLVNQLDENRQELLRLRFSAGLSFSQIGQIERRSEAAVKMMIYRTIEYLREKWEEDNG